jgi:hypothetical protein
MDPIDLGVTLLCVAVGEVTNWYIADQDCFGRHGASLCTIAQYRKAACYSGYRHPGAVWLSAFTDTGNVIVANDCGLEGFISASPFSNGVGGLCCLEFPQFGARP